MDDAGTSAERRNEAGVRRRRNPQGRGLLRRGGVAGLARRPATRCSRLLPNAAKSLRRSRPYPLISCS